MRNTDSFRDFVLDQLSAVSNVRAKLMFGGIGLYSNDIFFGILAGDVLYLKVDDTNRADYEATGGRPFKPYADNPMTMPYYDVAASVIEDATTLAAWAKRSIAVARAGKKAR
jgi:DNA transformation protein